MYTQNIRGFDGLIWAMWGNRPYARNTHDMTEVGSYLFMVFATAIPILLFYFLPLKYIFFIVLSGFNGFLLCLAISKANQSWWIPFGNLIIGLLGFYFHIRFDLSIFDFHFEQYFWELYVISGALAVSRRTWNFLIWKWLDRISLKHGISLA